MNLIELSKYLQDEALAEKYLLDNEILKTWIKCPNCNSDKLGKISRGRIKCYKCKKEWHKRKGSFLEGKQISFSKFIGFLKLYSDEIGVNRISEELQIDIKSAISIHSNIRHLIISQFIMNYDEKILKAFIWLDNDKIKIDFINPPTKAIHNTESYFELDFTRYKDFGNLYSFMVNSKWSGKKPHYYEMLDRFIGYLKIKLISYRGLRVNYFIDFLLEIIVKFNAREKLFYEILLEKLKISKGG